MYVCKHVCMYGRMYVCMDIRVQLCMQSLIVQKCFTLQINFAALDIVLASSHLRRTKNLQGQNKTDSFKTLSLENNEVIVEWNGQGQIDDRNLGSEDINNLNQNPRRSLIFNRMKLNLTLNDKSEFFDLNIDPYEQVNRIDDPKYSEIISEMQKKISLWQKNNNDLFRF